MADVTKEQHSALLRQYDNTSRDELRVVAARYVAERVYFTMFLERVQIGILSVDELPDKMRVAMDEFEVMLDRMDDTSQALPIIEAVGRKRDYVADAKRLLKVS